MNSYSGYGFIIDNKNDLSLFRKYLSSNPESEFKLSAFYLTPFTYDDSPSQESWCADRDDTLEHVKENYCYKDLCMLTTHSTRVKAVLSEKLWKEYEDNFESYTKYVCFIVLKGPLKLVNSLSMEWDESFRYHEEMELDWFFSITHLSGEPFKWSSIDYECKEFNLLVNLKYVVLFDS